MCEHRYLVVVGDLKPAVHGSVVSLLFYMSFKDLVFVFITMAPSIFVEEIERSLKGSHGCWYSHLLPMDYFTATMVLWTF